jgi:hypothetical protein
VRAPSTPSPYLPSAFDPAVVLITDFGRTPMRCDKFQILTWRAAAAAPDPYLLPNGKILFQSSFMLKTLQPSAGAASSALSSFPTLESRS